MTALARTESLDQRNAILERLVLRNRLVGILRIGVPAIGALVFAALALQIYIGNLVEQFGISRFTIDRNNLVVETPSFEATGKDGTLYKMSAELARVALDKTEDLSLAGVVIDVAPPGAPGFRAAVHDAMFSTRTQVLDIAGSVEVTGETGLHGSIAGLVVNLEKRSAEASGPVALTYPDGTAFTASTMSYDGKARIWHFTNVHMALVDTPKLAPAPTEGAPSP